MRRIGEIKIPEKDAYKIRSTTDYRLFKFISGNRRVDHAERIEKSIRQIGLLVSPIVVNQRFEIVDGQNRFTACKNLGLPIYYVVQEDIGGNEIGIINSASKNWTGMDHINYYAHGDAKIEDYIFFEQLVKAYPWATQRVISYAIHGLSGFGYVSKIKSGELKCSQEQYENAVKILDYVEQFREYVDGIGGRKENYYFTIAFCCTDDNVDNEYLLEKFKKYYKALDSVTSIKDALRQVEKKVYNYQMRSNREPVFLVEDYERAMRAKSSRKNGKEL